VNANSGNPHYEPRAEGSAPIRERRFRPAGCVAKKDVPGAVYYDITWTGFVGKTALGQAARKSSRTVRDARDAGVKNRARRYRCRPSGSPAGKWTAPPASTSERPATATTSFTAPDTRSAPTVHANGANMDDLEIHDERQILPNSCFR